MRGLRLFVRPLQPADLPAVVPFLDEHRGRPSPAPTTPFEGLLGKLLGDLVAVVRTRDEDDATVVEEIVVARELRKKQIGRAMLRETADLAAQRGRRRLLVASPGDDEEFFRHTGFEREGDRWVLTIPDAAPRG